jgi:hypothetical protein
MKTILAVIIAMIIATIITYLAGSFGSWEWNPGNWDESLRVLMIITWFVITFLTTVIILYANEKTP